MDLRFVLLLQYCLEWNLLSRIDIFSSKNKNHDIINNIMFLYFIKINLIVYIHTISLAMFQHVVLFF